MNTRRQQTNATKQYTQQAQMQATTTHDTTKNKKKNTSRKDTYGKQSHPQRQRRQE